jgi:glycosyltransferase involved in cell wall biosynthesis
LIYNSIKEIPRHFFANIPVIIPSFNQLYYIKNTIKQLEKFELKNFIILDNGSTYPELLKWFCNTNIPVLIDGRNPGPRHFFVDVSIWNNLPNYFVVTDPDLEYNKDTPNTMVDDLVEISEALRLPKVSLALDKSDINEMVPTVQEWEKEYWKNIIGKTKYGDPIYEAKTDTTFSLYNKKFVTRPGLLAWDADFFTAPRVAGRFTCKHWGWYFKRPVSKKEMQYYSGTQKWSSTEDELKKLGIRYND